MKQMQLPVSNGEQDSSFVNFRWLLANDGLEIVQPDNYYFGGLIRSMVVKGKLKVPTGPGMGVTSIRNKSKDMKS